MASQRELDHQFRMGVLNSVTSVVRALIRFGMVAAAFTAAVFAIRALAGKTTLADLEFKAFAELHANKYGALIVSWIYGVGATGWALGERAVRRRNIKRLTGESKDMHKFVDQKRRSSQLMIDGRTRPEDE